MLVQPTTMVPAMREIVVPVADDPVAEAEEQLREKTINDARETLSRMVGLLDPKNGTSASRALMLIQQTAQSFSELVATLGTGMIPVRPKRMFGGLGEGGTYNGGGLFPTVPQSPDETFGAQIASQFTSAIKQTNAPQGINNLVEALATAKEAGLTEEAGLIQKKLRRILCEETVTEELS